MKQDYEKALNEYFDEMFEETFENEEGELYLLFSLVYYMAGHFRGKGKSSYGFSSLFEEKRDVINPNWITPKGWTFRKTYTYLSIMFKKLDIKVDVDFSKEKIEDFINILNKGKKRKFNYYKTENPYVDRFINKEETSIFFEEPLFLYLEDEFYEWIEIKNNFNTDENIEKILDLIDEKIIDFVDGTLEKNYGVYSFNRQKEILLNKLATFQNLYGNMFRISEDNFWEKGNEKSFCYIYFFIFLFRSEHISISDIFSVDEIPLFDEEGGYLCENEKYSFTVHLKTKLIDLIQSWTNLKEVILDKIFDEEYKQITVKKKNGQPHLLEGKLEVLGDENKFIELKKKFPTSDINTKNYKGKTQKYQITEKLYLDNKDK